MGVKKKKTKRVACRGCVRWKRKALEAQGLQALLEQERLEVGRLKNLLSMSNHEAVALQARIDKVREALSTPEYKGPSGGSDVRSIDPYGQWTAASERERIRGMTKPENQG